MAAFVKDNLKHKQSSISLVGELAPYLSLGSQLTVTILIIGAVGWWLDQRFGTSPMWIVVCLIIGVFIGMYNLLRTLSALSKREKEHSKSEHHKH